MKKKRKSGGHSHRDVNGLNRNSVSGVVLGCKLREVEPPPGGVLLDSVPLAPAAHDAFTERELNARIRAYSRRAAKGLPLFGTGEPERKSAGDRNYPQCWACGAFAETSQPHATFGWSTRDCRVGATNAVECYCVTCMDRWGWPSEYPLWAELRRG